MKEEKKQERSFELRSEKVRNIVGQIPSSLVRYGITVIGIVLICILTITYFIPYKQVYSGTATVHEINTDSNIDSTDIAVLLKFKNKQPSNVGGQPIYMQSIKGTIKGQILQLSSIMDTLDRQEAICRFRKTEIKQTKHQTLDFHIVHSSGNILKKMFGGLQV